MVAVRNSLDSYVAPDLEVDDCELRWVRIRLRGRRTLYVCAYYRPDVADEPSMTKLRCCFDFRIWHKTTERYYHLYLGATITSLVYINIRHKLTGLQELKLPHGSVSEMCALFCASSTILF